MPRKTRLVAPASSRSRTTTVVKVRPNPMVWEAALKLAKGDPKLIEIVHPEELVVRNAPVR